MPAPLLALLARACLLLLLVRALRLALALRRLRVRVRALHRQAEAAGRALVPRRELRQRQGSD